MAPQQTDQSQSPTGPPRRYEVFKESHIGVCLSALEGQARSANGNGPPGNFDRDQNFGR